MCGICGAVSFNRNSVAEYVTSMTSRLRHRGPDGEGYTFFSDRDALAVAGNDTTKSLLSSSLPYAPSTRIDAVTDSFNIGFGHRRLTVIDLHDTGHQPMCDSEK